MMMTKTVKYWGPVVLWMGFTYVMSTDAFSSEHTSRIIEPILRFLFPSISPHALHLVHFAIRKLAHLTEYFVLGLLLFRAIRSGSIERRSLRWAMVSLILVALFAAGDEFHQMFVASRGPSIIDVAIDTTGGILALLLAVLNHHRRQRVPDTQ